MTQSPIEPPNNPSASSSTSDRAASGGAGGRAGGRSSGSTGASRPLTFDEGVALLVAFLSLGSVLFWGLTRGGMNLLDGAVADNPALNVAGDERLSAFDFGEDESEITGADGSAVGGRATTRISKDIDNDGVDETIIVERPRRRILDDVRTGVAGAAGGIAGSAALSDGVDATVIDNDAAPDGEVAVEETPEPAEATAEAPQLSAEATADPQEAVSFSDVPDNYWAKPYIDALSSRGLIAGFDNGTFRPDQPVTRAQTANIVSRTFDLTADKENLEFSDVAGDYWARESIGEVVRGGFMTGFPNDTFAPNEPVTRTQAFTTLVTGLNIEPPTNVQAAIDRYTDANAIPSWATGKVAAATSSGLVVNYPNQQKLNPNEPTTRAELSAIIYQALERQGIVEPIESEYVVKP